MNFELKNRPDFAHVRLVLANGDQVVTETGAMMAMSPGLKVDTNMQGGLWAAAKRALGGESFFVNTYTATADGQQLDLAPAMPGDLEHVELAGNAVMCQRGAFVASSKEVTCDTKWGGAKTFFSGEGLLMLRCSGNGHLWFGSYGAIHKVDVVGSYTVDTTHIVAFDESLTFSVKPVGGMKSLFLSGEGLVCEFKGTGRLWFQTRSAPALAAFLNPFRKVKPKSNN